jgi:hypothetical protein
MCDDARMTTPPGHFTLLPSGEYQPGPTAQSHWGEDHLNGPALVGLAACVLEEHHGLPEFLPARITVDLFKAARAVPTAVSTRLVRDGRRVRNSECELLQDGVPVVRATLVQYRRGDAPRGREWHAEREFVVPPDVDVSEYIYVGSDDVGWSRAIVEHQNAARKRSLTRSVTVVVGRRNSAFVNAAMAAEGTSLVTNLGTEGVGYINGDLTVALSRLPVDEWVGVEADSHVAADGISVGTATLFDSAGAFGTGVVTAVSNPAAQIDFANDPFPERGAGLKKTLDT